jgi:hypothetical protein
VHRSIVSPKEENFAKEKSENRDKWLSSLLGIVYFWCPGSHSKFLPFIYFSPVNMVQENVIERNCPTSLFLAKSGMVRYTTIRFFSIFYFILL